MKWYGFEQEPKSDGSFVYVRSEGISRFVFIYHYSVQDAFNDYLSPYSEVSWKFLGDYGNIDNIEKFDIGRKLLPDGSYELFTHNEYGWIVGFFKTVRTDFDVDGYGLEVSMLGCGEIFPVNKLGIDEYNLVTAPSPDSTLSRNGSVTVNSTGLRVFKNETKSAQYKMLWSKDRETLEELREEVQQLQDNIKDLLEEIDERVMFS